MKKLKDTYNMIENKSKDRGAKFARYGWTHLRQIFRHYLIQPLRVEND